jgi:hypothetical protein
MDPVIRTGHKDSLTNQNKKSAGEIRNGIRFISKITINAHAFDEATGAIHYRAG